MLRKVLYSILVFILLAVALLAPRLVGIDKFTTGDEPAWLIFSHNFLHAIDIGEFERTAYEYHPAITTMWTITAGILSYFPGYIRIQHRYIEKFWELDNIYANFKKSLSIVLYRSRMINVAVVCTALLLAFFLLRKLLDTRTALVAILLVGFDPFYLGQSRILNHEGMASAFVLVAVLSLLVFINQGEKYRYLLISSGAAGLALLTKSPTILLIPLAGLMFLLNIAFSWKDIRKRKMLIWSGIKQYLIWLGGLILVYIILWPGMWVAPGNMLFTVYGNAVSYAFQGQRLAAAQEINPAKFGLDVGGIGEYLVSILYKTTPVLWLGVCLALIGVTTRKIAPMSRNTKQVLFYLFLLTALYILVFGVVRGWNSLHYIMVAFVSLEVIAAIGYVWGVSWLGEKSTFFGKKSVQAVILSALVLLQASSGVLDFPYYYTYVNPLAHFVKPEMKDTTVGYGEGLELAAAYLSAKPGAKDLTVSSHLGRGPFSYYFPGTTYPLMYQSRDYLTDRSAEWVRQSDYLVIYDIQQRPLNMGAKLLAALDGVQPEHVVMLNGLRYASIYKVSELPQKVLDALLPPKKQ
jgi:4-amino-4-deoxy-L-arabinose transferase-like glycosyltransferase